MATITTLPTLQECAAAAGVPDESPDRSRDLLDGHVVNTDFILAMSGHKKQLPTGAEGQNNQLAGADPLVDDLVVRIDGTVRCWTIEAEFAALASAAGEQTRTAEK